MKRPRPHDLKALRRTAPVLLAALAMLVRLVVAVMPMTAAPAAAAGSEAAAFVALLGGAICHGGDEPDGGTGAPAPGHPATDCELCPFCVGLAVVDVAPAPVPAVRVAYVRFVVPAPGAGPPPARFVGARPRGPPAA